MREETGDAPRLPSGPLHDAAEMVPHMPVVMMFAYSSNGLSHCKEEDTPAPHLEATIRAYLRLVGEDDRPRLSTALKAPVFCDSEAGDRPILRACATSAGC